MRRKTLRFGSPTNTTPPGLDGMVIRFPFTMVDSQLVGAAEECQKTSRHTLDVTISRTRRAAWNMDDSDLVRVLFEIGKRKCDERLQEGDLPEHVAVEVTAATHPAECLFDPERISNPDGAEVVVEIRSKIGFV